MKVAAYSPEEKATMKERRHKQDVKSETIRRQLFPVKQTRMFSVPLFLALNLSFFFFFFSCFFLGL